MSFILLQFWVLCSPLKNMNFSFLHFCIFFAGFAFYAFPFILDLFFFFSNFLRNQGNFCRFFLRFFFIFAKLKSLNLCRVSLSLFSLFCLDSKQEAEPVVRGTKTSNYHLACLLLKLFCLRTNRRQPNFKPFEDHYFTTKDTELAVKSQLPSLQATSLEMR